MAFADRSRLSAGTSGDAGSGRMRTMWNRHGGASTRYAPNGLCGAQTIPQRVGPDGKQSKIIVGCRPHRAGGGGRRSMRSRKHANALPEMPSCGNGGAARADEGSNYFLKRRSNASRASIALRGAGAFTPGIGGRPFCWLETSRATVTRGEKSEHSFAWSFTGIRTGMGLRH